MWRCLCVTAVSLIQSEHFLHRERRSEMRSAGAKASAPSTPGQGEAHFCGFTSGGNLLKSELASEPVWSDYVEVHRRERSRGCGGRYLVWKCTEHETCGGFGDEIRGISAMLYLAIATKRALVLDWRKDGVPYAGHIFDVNEVNWTVPEKCTWKLGLNSNLFHVVDPPFAGLGNLVKSSAAILTQEENGIASSEMSRGGRVSLLAVEAKTANLVTGAQSPAQVIQVITNLQTPQQSPDVWKVALESLPVLKEISGVATLSVGCAYRFLFKPTSALQEAYERIRLPRSGFIGIHLRTGDKEKQNSSADFSRWKLGVSLLAECVGTGLQLLRGNGLAPSACQKPASELAFFSDSQAVKEFSRTAGMLVTGVLPLHSEKDHMSAEQRVSTMAELHALADSTILLTDTRRSGFAHLALELGKIIQGRPVESFGMRILPDAVEICKDRSKGHPFQTFGDSSPEALALDTRQKDDICVVLTKAPGTRAMQAQREL